MTDQDTIRHLLSRINEAWLRGRPEDIPGKLDDCFHLDVVFSDATMQPLGRGKRACIDSYAQFVKQAEVLECRFGEPAVYVCENTAVASYRWQIRYDMNGQEFRETGQDLFVFTRSHGHWKVTWRGMLPAAAGSE